RLDLRVLLSEPVEQRQLIFGVIPRSGCALLPANPQAQAALRTEGHEGPKRHVVAHRPWHEAHTRRESADEHTVAGRSSVSQCNQRGEHSDRRSEGQVRTSQNSAPKSKASEDRGASAFTRQRPEREYDQRNRKRLTEQRVDVVKLVDGYR